MAEEELNEVDRIPAGWGIDGLIAQRFLGWTKGGIDNRNQPYQFYWYSPEGGRHQAPPQLSIDLNLAMKVVDAIFDLGWRFAMTQNSDKHLAIAFVPVGEDYEPERAIKVTVVSPLLAAVGICRAALLVAERLHEAERIELPVM